MLSVGSAIIAKSCFSGNNLTGFVQV